VLTSSKADDDVAKVYGLHANCYIVKPVDFQDLTQVA
jgi:chemotaxis family two-component system response regulator Rcp1